MSLFHRCKICYKITFNKKTVKVMKGMCRGAFVTTTEELYCKDCALDYTDKLARSYIELKTTEILQG